MFDIQAVKTIVDACVMGIPLFLVVLGLVEFVKAAGVVGKALLYTSMAIGVVLGIGYQITQLGLPTAFAGWFGYAVYGLSLGLLASGIFDIGANLVKKAVDKIQRL